MENWGGRRKSETQARKHESRRNRQRKRGDSKSEREGEEEGRWRKCGWGGGKRKRMGSVGGCSLTKWGWIVSMTVGWWGSLASISEMLISHREVSQPPHRLSASSPVDEHQLINIFLSEAAMLVTNVTSWLNVPLEFHTYRIYEELMINWHKEIMPF